MGEDIFAPFPDPAAVAAFGLDRHFFCVCPHMLMQNSSLLSSLTVVWSRGVDIIVQQSE